MVTSGGSILGEVDGFTLEDVEEGLGRLEDLHVRTLTLVEGPVVRFPSCNLPCQRLINPREPLRQDAEVCSSTTWLVCVWGKTRDKRVVRWVGRDDVPLLILAFSSSSFKMDLEICSLFSRSSSMPNTNNR